MGFKASFFFFFAAGLSPFALCAGVARGGFCSSVGCSPFILALALVCKMEQAGASTREFAPMF
jgi:hypothetical protein